MNDKGQATWQHSCAVLTISDKGAVGEREDTSGFQLAERIARHDSFQVIKRHLVPDDSRKIKDILCQWTDVDRIDLILTTGGTGVSPRDLTPEATKQIIEKEVPGIAEVMRQASFHKTPYAVLSRGIAGIRKTSLIINLPGSEKGALENLETILPALPHALYKIKGGSRDCSS